MIAPYYDADLSNFKKWDAPARDVSGLRGFKYTTRANNFGLHEEYGRAIAGAK